MKIVIFLYIFFIFLLSCNQKTVDIKTSGIVDTPQLEVIGGNDLGIMKLGSPLKQIQLKLTNYSKYSLKDISLVIDANSSMSVKFTKNLLDQAIFPGAGDCKSTLKAGLSCSIVLQYNPLVEGKFTQDITLHYTNLIETKDIIKTLKVWTGRDANLSISNNDSNNFQFGIIESTDTTTIRTQDVILKNIGGLPANVTSTISPSTMDPAFQKTFDSCTNHQINPTETCKITIKYSPNIDSPKDYNGDLTIDYIKNPLNESQQAIFNFKFHAETIEGILTTTSSSSISFTTITQGNKSNFQDIFLSNLGYKEVILQKIYFINNGVLIAKCFKNLAGDTDLKCIDPAAATSAANLSLKDFPFKMQDNTGCMLPIASQDYSNPQQIINNGQYAIKGKDLIDPSISPGSCNLKLLFWPSINYTYSQDDRKKWNDTRIVYQYDSTWKNNKFIYPSSSGYTFPGIMNNYSTTQNILDLSSTAPLNISKAEYDFKASLFLDATKFKNKSITSNCPTATNNIVPCLLSPSSYNATQVQRTFSLGQIPLLNSIVVDPTVQANIDKYSSKLSLVLKHTGSSTGFNVASNILIKSHDITYPINSTPTPLFEVTASNSNSFPYFKNINNLCSGINLDGNSTCNLSFNIMPTNITTSPNTSLFSARQGSENSASERIFEVRYNDGASINDDGTSHLAPVFYFSFKANISSIGNLAYLNSQNNVVNTSRLAFNENAKNITPSTADTTLSQSLIKTIYFTNIGTGNISDLILDSSKHSFDNLFYQYANDASMPHLLKFFPTPSGRLNSLTFDCLKLPSFQSDTSFSGVLDSKAITFIAANSASPQFLISPSSANSNNSRCGLSYILDMPKDYIYKTKDYKNNGINNPASALPNISRDSNDIAKLSSSLYLKTSSNDFLNSSDNLDFLPFPNSDGSFYKQKYLLFFQSKFDGTHISDVSSNNANMAYNIEIIFKKPAQLIVNPGIPKINSVSMRPSFNLYYPNADGTTAATTISEVISSYFAFNIGYNGITSPYFLKERYQNQQTNNQTSLLAKSQEYDYLLEVGSFTTNTTSAISFNIQNTGELTAIFNSISQITASSKLSFVSGTTTGASINPSISQTIKANLNLTGVATGDYFEDIVITYNDGRISSDSVNFCDPVEVLSSNTCSTTKTSARNIKTLKLRIAYHVLATKPALEFVLANYDSSYSSILSASKMTPNNVYNFDDVKDTNATNRRIYILQRNRGATPTFFDKFQSFNALQKALHQRSGYYPANIAGVSLGNFICPSTNSTTVNSLDPKIQNVLTSTGASLADSLDYCYFDISYNNSQNASTKAVDLKIFTLLSAPQVLTHRLNQYQENLFKINFIGKSPALLNPSINTYSTSTTGDTLFINVGDLSSANHQVMQLNSTSGDARSTDKNFYINITNPNPDTTIKGNFLSQYLIYKNITGCKDVKNLSTCVSPNTPPAIPSKSLNSTIFSDSYLQVDASPLCFYNSPASSSVAATLLDVLNEGFSGANICTLKVIMHLSPQHYLQDGVTLPFTSPNGSTINLSYINYYNLTSQTISTSSFHFNFLGTIENPISNFIGTSGEQLESVDSTGNISISYNDVNASATVQEYRLYYSELKNNLDFLYNTSIPYVIGSKDQISGKIIFNVSGLTPSTYYYFKPIVRRKCGTNCSTTTTLYTSQILGTETPSSFLIPPFGYNLLKSNSNNYLVEDSLHSGNKVNFISAKNECSQVQLNLKKDGISGINPSVSILSTNILEVLKTTPALTSYTPLELEGIWLNDTAFDVSAANLFGANAINLLSDTQVIATTQESFQRLCSDNTCPISLRKTYGRLLFIQTNNYNYLDPNIPKASARCYFIP